MKDSETYLTNASRGKGVRSFKEVAVQYYPIVIPEVASRQLRRDIMEYRALSDAMSKAGFRRSQKRLTPKQVGILYTYLGEP